MNVALFVTCLVDQAAARAGVAAARLLERLGCEVSFPEDQTCCGQPAWNSGYAEPARAAARTMIEAFAGAHAVVSPSGSCAGMVKHHYPELFRGDPEWLPRARELADKTYELSQFIVRVLGVTELGGRFPHTVSYHPSCHALRLLGVGQEPVLLLRNVQDLELVPFARAEDCCGFGGTFAIKLPQLSGAMVDEKAAHLEAAGATHLVSTDVGCLLHIAGRLERRGARVRSLHLAELLCESLAEPLP